MQIENGIENFQICLPVYNIIQSFILWINKRVGMTQEECLLLNYQNGFVKAEMMPRRKRQFGKKKTGGALSVWFTFPVTICLIHCCLFYSYKLC